MLQQFFLSIQQPLALVRCGPAKRISSRGACSQQIFEKISHLFLLPLKRLHKFLLTGLTGHCWSTCLTLVDILIKKLRILLKDDFFFDLPLNERLRDDLVVRATHIDFHNRVVDKCWFVIAEWNEDGLLVNGVRPEPQRKLVGPMQHVLVKQPKVGVVSYRSEDKRPPVYFGKELHLTQRCLKWYIMSNILVADS